MCVRLGYEFLAPSVRPLRSCNLSGQGGGQKGRVTVRLHPAREPIEQAPVVTLRRMILVVWYGILLPLGKKSSVTDLATTHDRAVITTRSTPSSHHGARRGSYRLARCAARAPPARVHCRGRYHYI